jgi:hypothetical protein
VVFELYHGQTWFFQNYHSGDVLDTAVNGWERFRSEGKGEWEEQTVVKEEHIADQLVPRDDS